MSLVWFSLIEYKEVLTIYSRRGVGLGRIQKELIAKNRKTYVANIVLLLYD
jgi:hypothetical protein